MGKTIAQLIPGLIASIGALCLGSIIGWSSPAQQPVTEGDLGYSVSNSEFSWIGSLFVLGAGFTCIPAGFIINAIGRKMTMILFCIPGLLGWVAMMAGNSIGFAYAARFLLGVGGGSFCVSVPMYTTEIAEVRIRGLLGTLFQLFITTGILLSYIFGAFVNMLTLSIICCCFFGILLVSLLFIPESPVYYIAKGKTEKAEKSMAKLRGKDNDSSGELRDMQEADKASKENKPPLLQSFCAKPSLKAFFLCLAVHVSQQFGGINAVVFYLTSIMMDSNSSLEPKYITIIFGVIMCLSTLISTLVIDRVGRKILLIISGSSMALCCLLIGIYFYLKDHGDDVSSFTWLPILSIFVYNIGFSLGMGPVPWLLLGEIFAPEVKSFAGSIVATSNWFCAFIVTLSFNHVTEGIGVGPTFWIFGIVNILLVLLTIFLLPETRNKSSAEIQSAFGG